MTKRLETLFSLIDECEVFADIGCDHGLISQAVLNFDKAKKVYASDISAPSLQKARDLLGEDYEGRFYCFVSDGFDSVPDDADQALIAGMGGEEIVLILKKAAKLPEKLILQPMKNAEKLRRFLVGIGYGIVRDFTFFDGNKFYDVIKAVKGAAVPDYSDDEFEFGRDNLASLSPDFCRYVQKRAETLSSVVDGMNEADRAETLFKIQKLKGLLL